MSSNQLFVVSPTIKLNKLLNDKSSVDSNKMKFKLSENLNNESSVSYDAKSSVNNIQNNI